MKAIVAMDLNRVIGYKGKMPWHIPEDLKWFKKMTMGDTLLMGNTTFKSVGALPGRYTFVLTRDEKTPRQFSNYSYITEPAVYGMNNMGLWLCGGASMYNKFLPLCEEVYATIIIDEYEGDTFMPHFEEDFPYSQILREEKDFWMVKYWRSPIIEFNS